MVSALDSRLSGPGLSPGQGHHVVFLGETLYSHSASLDSGINGNWARELTLMMGGNPAMVYIVASLQGGSRSTPSCFMLQKPG